MNAVPQAAVPDSGVGLVLKDPSCALVERVALLAEQGGFSHLLFTELSVPDGERITGRDPFVLAAVALAATDRLRAGTGVAGTVFHTPRHLALRAATLQEQSGGRFVLGCGVSHRGFADALGVAYPDAPVAHAREYCDALRAVAARLAFGAGFPVWLAALGDRMAAAGAAHADGIVLNWVSPQQTRRTVTAATERAGRRPTVAVFVRTGPREALQKAAAGYFDAFANYARHFARQGLADPGAVVEATCAPREDGPPLAERVAAHRDAGADLVCAYPADLDADAVAAFVAGADLTEHA